MLKSVLLHSMPTLQVHPALVASIDVSNAQLQINVKYASQDSSFKVDQMDQTLNVLMNVLLDSSKVLQEDVNLV